MLFHSVRGPHCERESVRVAYLVAGDGARSTVRHALGIDYVGGAIPDAHWLVGDVDIDGLAQPEPTTGANGYAIETARALLYTATGLESTATGRGQPDPSHLLAAMNDPRMHAQLSGLLIRYPDSPLSLTWGETTHAQIVAGDRAPDAPCQDPVTGQTVRLFDVNRGPHWTLLGFGRPGAAMVRTFRAPPFLDVRVQAVVPPAEAALEPAALSDTDGHAGRAFEVDECAVVLIRPDNGIGLLARPAEPAALERYVERLRHGPRV